jgi:hypothetical protein
MSLRQKIEQDIKTAMLAQRSGARHHADGTQQHQEPRDGEREGFDG